jgi:hypothetical protein
MSRLSLDLKPNETISINGGAIRITLVKKSGQLARLEIVAPEDTDIELPRRGAEQQARKSALQPE